MRARRERDRQLDILECLGRLSRQYGELVGDWIGSGEVQGGGGPRRRSGEREGQKAATRSI
jgi:hypothetical protein